MTYFETMCRAYGLPKPVPEYQFHASRKWRTDYYFEANGVKIAVEIEGGVWTQGRHTRGKGFVADMEKYNQYAILGILLLRFTPDDLKKSATYEIIKEVLTNV